MYCMIAVSLHSPAINTSKHQAWERARTSGPTYRTTRISAAMTRQVMGAMLLTNLGSSSSNAPIPRLSSSRRVHRWRAHGLSVHNPQAITGDANATTNATPAAKPVKMEIPLTMTGCPGAKSSAIRIRLKYSPDNGNNLRPEPVRTPAR